MKYLAIVFLTGFLTLSAGAQTAAGQESGLVNNLWSVAGSGGRPDVNSMTLQYFINPNLKRGYYLTSAPINSANWNAPSDNVWLVPVGGGIGRIMRLGFHPVNVSIQAYGNAKRPDTLPCPTWQLKFQIAFLACVP